MTLFPSDKPIKTIEEEEAEVNQDDSKAETSINPSSSSSSSVDFFLGSDSGSDGFVVNNEFGKFDDEGMEMVEEESGCFISDWVVSDEIRSISDDDLLINVATLPVGVVLSVKGKQVIVEGKEKSNLLSTGSFLWITETRVPLGYVDEIFGTIEKPCYSVRLELDSQVPSGIRQGTQVSLIVTESSRDADVDKIVCSDDSYKSQTTPGSDGLVPQNLKLPRSDGFDANSAPKRPYRHPMSNERGIVPNPIPVPVQAPTMMIPMPMPMYPPPHLVLHQPYPNAGHWPNVNPNPYLPHQQTKYHQRRPSKIQLKSNVGPPPPSSSDHRGKMMHYRGAGTNRGFGRGRGRRDDNKDEKRW